MTLQGYGNPLSPTGRAALVDDVPHHISAEALHVVFRVDPDAAAPYLPPQLSLGEDPMGFAFVADMAKVSAAKADAGAPEPQTAQYNEGIVGLYCHHNGAPGRFSAFIWVNRDWSAVFGHFMGFAKKMGDVYKTRHHSANPAMGPAGPGTILRGTVDRGGYRLLDMSVELTERLPDDGIPSYGHRVYLYRHLPSPSPDLPESRNLLALDLAGATTINCWRGRGAVNLGTSPTEELDGLQPVEIVDAFAYERGWTTDATARLLH